MSILYADENSIECSSYNVAVIEQKVNHELNVLDHEWSKQWHLQLNPNKTKAMIFTMKKSADPQKTEFFQQCHLEYVTVHNHLGLTFSNDLKWSLYINNIVNNAYKNLGC